MRSWDDPLASGGSARASTRAASAPAKVARGRRRAPLSLYMPADCPERSAELLFQPQQLRHVVGLHEAACALGRHPRHHAADRVAEWPLPRLALPLRLRSRAQRRLREVCRGPLGLAAVHLWPVELQPAAEPQLAYAEGSGQLPGKASGRPPPGTSRPPTRDAHPASFASRRRAPRAQGGGRGVGRGVVGEGRAQGGGRGVGRVGEGCAQPQGGGRGVGSAVGVNSGGRERSPGRLRGPSRRMS